MRRLVSIAAVSYGKRHDIDYTGLDLFFRILSRVDANTEWYSLEPLGIVVNKMTISVAIYLAELPLKLQFYTNVFSKSHLAIKDEPGRDGSTSIDPGGGQTQP